MSENKTDEEFKEPQGLMPDADLNDMRPSNNLQDRPSNNFRTSNMYSRTSGTINRPSDFRYSFNDSRVSDSIRPSIAEPKTKHVFKIILLGDVFVGKTAISTRIMTNEFHSEYKCSLGVEFKVKSFVVDEETKIDLRIFDTMGDEKYRAVTRQYYNDSAGILLVFDITSEKSFLSLESWLKDIADYAPKDCVVFIVGNKSDLNSERKVSHDDAENFAENKNLYFLEVSAKKGVNINLLFEKMCKELIIKAQEKAEREKVEDNPRKSRNMMLIKEVQKMESKKKKSSCC